MEAVLIYSLLAGAATLLGCLGVLAVGRPGERTLAFLLGAAAGVMLAVVGLDLLPSALHYGGFLNALLGFCIGLILMWLLALLFSNGQAPQALTVSRSYFLRLGYLTALGIAMHDLPEGMAIAAGYIAAEKLGLAIALAIGLHNIPEGMATTTPLLMGGISPSRIFALNALVSLFTPFGALIGFNFIGTSVLLLAALLSLAAGAMFYLAFFMLFPESCRHHPRFSKMGLCLGALVFGALNL